MSLCLNMIVKDEAHIIKDTLENICAHLPITHWVISDTGSSDNTVEIIEEYFKKRGIEGRIYHDQWKDFGHNRNEALKHCAGKSDYILIFDADDRIEGQLDLPELDADCKFDSYMMKLTSESRNISYLRKLIVKNNNSYRWRGVLHEFLECENSESVGVVKGEYVVISGRKGNRSKNNDKYLEDAQVLENAFLLGEKTGEDLDLLPRYSFYCAQSYRDAGIIDKAIEWYKKRTGIKSGWSDEVYCSYIELGLLFEKKKSFATAFNYWQQGIIHDPNRAECWYHTSRRHSWNGHRELAYIYAKQASELELPKGNRLFVGRSIYRYWSYYELCINAYKLKKIDESYEAFKKMISYCPQHLLDKVSHQMASYVELIISDTFSNVNKLNKNLIRLNRADLLEDTITQK